MKGSVPMTTTGLRLGIKAHNKCGRVYPVLETLTPPGHSCYDTNKHLFSNFQTYFFFWSFLYNNINFLGKVLRQITSQPNIYMSQWMEVWVLIWIIYAFLDKCVDVLKIKVNYIWTEPIFYSTYYNNLYFNEDMHNVHVWTIFLFLMTKDVKILFIDA